MHEKTLGFGRLHENKKKLFFENKIYFLIFWEKSDIFYTESVSNGVSLRPDIRQNY